MRSLFARIWLSYSLVILLTLAAAAVINFALAVERAADADRISPAVLADAASARLQAQGTDGLIDWIMQEAHSNPDLYVYILDSRGRELLGRKVAGRELSGSMGSMSPTLSSPSGVDYKMVVRRSNSFAFGIRDLLLQPFVLLALAIVASGIGSAVLAYIMTRPIVTLRAGVRAFASGRLDTRIGGDLKRRKDELGGLAQDFDQMADNLQAQIRAKEELLRDVSHELRSPLSRLRVAAGLARRSVPPTELGAFDRIDLEVERLDALIGQILRFSRLGSTPAAERESFDLAELLEEIAADAQIEAHALGIRVTLSVAENSEIDGDRAALRSAIENVVRNAIRFAPTNSDIEIRSSLRLKRACIEILDNGPGIANEHIERIFEPFYRGSGSDGSGLGLAITKRVITLHGGEISVANRSPRGLRVTILISRAG